MWAKKDRGAAAMEYVAMLLVAAVVAGAVAAGIKQEWVREKVCQALVAITGKGSCKPANPSKPPAQTPPKPCVTKSGKGATSVHLKGKITWVKLGGDAGYGYRLIEYSDGSADVELFYSLKGEAGAEQKIDGKGKFGADVSGTLSGKYQKGDTFHYNTVDAARVDEDRLKQYAQDRALAAIGLGNEPKMDGAPHSSSSDQWEFGVESKGDVGVNPKGKAGQSTIGGAGVKLNGTLLYTTTNDDKTGNVSTKIETLGSVDVSAQANVPGGRESDANVSPNIRFQGDRKSSVEVTKDKSGNIIELVITQSGAEGGGAGVDVGTGSTGRGKNPPKHMAEGPAKTPSDPNYKPRHMKDDPGPDPDPSVKGSGDEMSRSTTTYRLVVNDQNRDQVKAWLGGDGITPAAAPGLLYKSARIHPLDVKTDDDFAKFLQHSQDAQIDEQKSRQTSASSDNGLDFGVVSGGIKDDTESTSSTGQIYWPLENGKRVPEPVFGCK